MTPHTLWKSLETISAVAAHLCLRFLMAGCREGGREGGDTQTCQAPPHPIQEIPYYQRQLWHLRGTSTTVAFCSNCLSRPFKDSLPLFLTPFPPLLTCLSQLLNERPPFLLQPFCLVNNRALGDVCYNHHQMSCDPLCLVHHAAATTVFTMFSLSTHAHFFKQWFNLTERCLI